MLRLTAVTGFVLCYVAGGRGPKWVRRFLGSSLFGIGICILAMALGTFRWPLLLVPGLYIGALVLGYGGDSFFEKLFRRLLYGAAFGGIGLFVGLVTGHTFLAFLQFFLALGISPIMGLTNTEKAANEEAIVATMSTILVPFMV